MLRSDYYLSLSSDIKDRYDEKLKIINNIDPYVCPDMSTDLGVLPPVTQIDLFNYLILTHSYYTGKQMKAYKSLQAFKFYEAGYVRGLQALQVNDAFIVVAKVLHSQRRNEKPLHVWIILQEDGSVSTGHCTCMAGLSEVCSHVAALLFLLEAYPDKENVSCTENLAAWPVPSKSKGCDMLRVRDMDWARRTKTMENPVHQPVEPIEGEELVTFLKEIRDTGRVESAALRVCEPFATKIVEERSRELFVEGLENIYQANLEGESYETILQVCAGINFVLDDDWIKKIEEATRSQSKTNTWFKVRSGRITASKFKAASRANINKPPLSLIKAICYPQKVIFYSKATEYGKKYEKSTLQNYFDSIKEHHKNPRLLEAGFFISREHPQVGASPDALVACDCCGKGCVEVKCPFLMQTMSLDEYVERKTSFLIKIEEGEYAVKESHEYYYQIQLQMFCTGTKYCHFVIWSKEILVVLEIKYVQDFVTTNLERALHFHKFVIVPELVSRYFTSKAGLARVQTWCLCKKPDDNRPMIRCENDNCSIEWFHFDCVGLIAVPDDLWFCNNCSIGV